MAKLTDSILDTVKKQLGYPKELTNFDVDIIVCINAAFAVLQQIGFGPKNGFVIISSDETFGDYVNDDAAVSMVQMFLYLKTKLGFDPPSSSFVLESVKSMADEYQFRLQVLGSEMRNKEESE